MRLGYLFWVLSVAIAVIVGLSKFGIYTVPAVGPLLMQDSTLSLFVALALALLSKFVR